MTDIPDPDIEALEKLLDRLIAAPVDKVMNGQLNDTNRRLKSLGSELGEMEHGLKEAAEKRQKVSDQLIHDVATKIDGMINRITALVEEQQALRRVWQDAHAVAIQESKERDQSVVLSQRRQLYRLALLAPAAGLLSAAAVELIHHLL